jgi:multidrug efflux pump subunit AcrA (membrane-fusion protein)
MKNIQDPKEIKDFNEILANRVIVSKDGIVVFEKKEEAGKHTEDIQEIITKVPSWIVRWGITLLFSTILIMVAISVLVPYPEMVKSPMKLQSFGNSISVVADQSGLIIKVFVEKSMIVKHGQPLIEIKGINQEQYILKAPGDGRVGFSAIIQPGSIIERNQEIFKIHEPNEQFYGLMTIPKNAINKIKIGQEVLIKLAGSSSVDNNVMQGKIDFVADEPVNDRFLVKVAFAKPSLATRKVEIKSWMEFEAQIITKKSNLFHKVFGSIIDVYNNI